VDRNGKWWQVGRMCVGTGGFGRCVGVREWGETLGSMWLCGWVRKGTEGGFLGCGERFAGEKANHRLHPRSFLNVFPGGFAPGGLPRDASREPTQGGGPGDLPRTIP
jgi:hypothetical protein